MKLERERENRIEIENKNIYHITVYTRVIPRLSSIKIAELSKDNGTTNCWWIKR